MIIRINAAGWLSVDGLGKCELGYWCEKNIEESTTERLQMFYVQVLDRHIKLAENFAVDGECFVNFTASAKTIISRDLNEYTLGVDF